MLKYIKLSNYRVSNFWRNILITSLIIILVGAGYYGYQYYRVYKNPVIPAIDAISPQTPLFLEFKKPLQTIKKLNYQTDLWTELLNVQDINEINQQLLILNSYIIQEDYIRNIMEKQPMILAIQPDDSGNNKILYLIELKLSNESLNVDHFVRKVNGEKSILMRKQYHDAEVLMVNISGYESLLNYTVYKGLFIASFDENMVHEAIDQINSDNHLENNEHFKRLKITAGQNVDANVYVNYSTIAGWVSNLTSDKILPSINELIGFGLWTETDLIIKNDELLFNGYTTTSDTAIYYLSNFQQEPQKIDIPEILPFDISLLLHFGFEDFNSYQQSIKVYYSDNQKWQAYNTSFQAIQKKYNIDLYDLLISWVGNEVAIASTGNADIKSNSFVVLHTNDVKGAIEKLDRIISKVKAKTGKNPYQQAFGDYMIKKIDIPGFLPKVFGNNFDLIENNYFIAIKDYIVFANNPKQLVYLVNNFYLQKTLSENFNYQSFSTNISDRSNIYFYCNFRKSIGYLTKHLNPELQKVFNQNRRTISNFEGLAVQFSYYNEMFYTNLYLKYNPTYQEMNPSNWEVELDAQLYGKPCFIRNHKTGRLNVVAFDDLSNMYLIDQNGIIQWKIPLMEEPISPVYPVDYYNNGKIQYLFNTKNYLYLIDLNGNYVADYPIKLVTNATSPVVVLDYENDKDYRFLITLADNKIYNFDKQVKQIEGWNKFPAKSGVEQAIEYLVNDGKDYLFITDEKGNVLCVNRKGEERLKLKRQFKKAENSKFYINRTNSKGVFISTDEKGNLVYITEDGKISKTSFGEFSEDHFFLYKDLSGNNINDFIFLDKKKLIVFDKFKKVSFSYTFKHDIEIQPIFFKGKGNRNFLAVVSAREEKVYIFHKNGLAFTDLGIKGTSEFITGSLNNDDKVNLIIGSGNKLMNYLLE